MDESKRGQDPCNSYWPGHHVHFIQARLSRESVDEHPPRLGTLIGVDDNGVFDIDVGGDVVRLWNHLPRRLRSRLERGDTDVELRKHSVMAIGSSLFSIRDAGDDERIECVASGPVD